MAVGAPYESSGAKGINGNQNDTSVYSAGAVYIFTRVNNAWTQQAYIKASNPGQSYRFGHFVSLSQDGQHAGRLRVFRGQRRQGHQRRPERQIHPAGRRGLRLHAHRHHLEPAGLYQGLEHRRSGVGDQLGDGDQFGFSIGLSADGNTLAVGAIAEDSGAKGINGDQNDNSQMGSGAVYVYTRTGTTWSQQAYVKQSNTDANDLFGYAVGLSADGNTLAASAYDEDSSAREINGVMDRGRRGSGAIYVFTRTGTTWAQTAYLKASNAEAGDSLGVRYGDQPGRQHHRRRRAATKTASRRGSIPRKNATTISKPIPPPARRTFLSATAAPGPSRRSSRPRTPARKTGSGRA